MATLTDVRETFGENRRSAIQSETNITYSRVFYVTFDDEVVNLQDVLDASGLPAIGDFYIDSGTYSTCRTREVLEQDGSRSQFVVICTYDSAVDDESGTLDGNPLNDNWKVGVSSRDRAIAPASLYQYDQVTDLWVDRPVRNTAKDEFNPTVNIQSNDLTITLTKNYSAIQWALLEHQNKANQSSVEIWDKTFEARNLFLDSIQVSGYQERNGTGFYTHTFKIHRRIPLLDTIEGYPGGGWDLVLYNAGYNQLKAGPPIVKTRILIAGSPASTPQPLDEDGAYDPDEELYIQYKLHTVAFSVFNFPTSADE